MGRILTSDWRHRARKLVTNYADTILVIGLNANDALLHTAHAKKEVPSSSGPCAWFQSRVERAMHRIRNT